MCQGEEAPNPGAGTSHSHYGGGAAPPPPSPPPQAPVSEHASTTAEEGARKVDLRTEKSDNENYNGNSFLDDHASQHLLGEKVDSTSDSSRKELSAKEQIEALFPDFKGGSYIFEQKIILLSQKYEFFRRTARDGNCFYRAFIFSYLEHVSEMQDGSERINEVRHLRLCVRNTKQAYENFGFPTIAEANFLDACNELEYVLNLIESGISAIELYETDWREKTISRILPFLRFLVTVELCTREDLYYPFVCSEAESIYEFCQYEVIPDKAEANEYQITALVNAMGIPLIVEILDTSLNNGVVQLNLRDYCPRLDVEVSQVEEFELQSSETCSSSSSSDAKRRKIADRSLAERRKDGPTRNSGKHATVRRPHVLISTLRRVLYWRASEIPP